MSKTFKLSKEKAVNLVGHKRRLMGVVRDAFKNFEHDHPGVLIPLKTSLEKRIIGSVTHYLLRFNGDRIMFNWLEENRHRFKEIQEIQGSLSDIVYDMITEERVGIKK